MSFVEHNDLVEQVPSAVADPSLCNPILPRAAEAGSLGFDAEGLDCADDFFVEVRAAIKEQISRRRIIGKGLAELLDDPRTGRMPGDIAVKNTTPVDLKLIGVWMFARGVVDLIEAAMLPPLLGRSTSSNQNESLP